MAEGKVDNVRIKSESAEVVEEEEVILGQSTAVNQADVEATINFTFSVSLTTALTVSSGSPGDRVHFRSPKAEVCIGSVLVSIPAIDQTLVWGETIENKKNDVVTTTVVVPKKSSVTCEYVATRRMFMIPFSYTLEVNNTLTEHGDGIFIAVQYYDFHFKNEFQPL